MIDNLEYFKGGKEMKRKLICLASIFVVILTLSVCSSEVAQAKAIVYPKTKHSVHEMYEKHDDFLGGNPGNPGKKGNSGKKGNPGKKGKSGKRGNSGKGRFIIVYW